MKDSGMSDSQFMEAQKNFRERCNVYNTFVNSLSEDKRPENFWQRLLTFFKKMLKYK
jgi:hypothetical protein